MHYSAGKKAELSRSATASMINFSRLGFCATARVSSVVYDSNLNAFVDYEDLKIAPMELTIADRAAELLKGKTGLSIKFFNPDFNLALTARLINHEDSSICLMELSARDFYRLFIPDKNMLLESVILAGSECVNALAGVGAMEVDWEPYDAHELINFLLDGPPGYEGNPPPTGIIRTEYVNTNALLMEKLKKSYDFIPQSQHTILLRKGAAQLFASL